MTVMETESKIIEFYSHSKILVTGGTGFMGKVLIDKLLRVCTGVQHVYLVIRIKKGKDTCTRLKELFDDPVFERLRKDSPDYANKVSCIVGDCGLPDLGMSEDDRHFLSKEITHVFHAAATVRFDEKLKTAININVFGVQEMLKFCKSCDNLKVVVHISTAYSNCVQDKIDEKFYEPPIHPSVAMELTKVFSDSKLDEITPDLIKPWPNTYSFTKAIAENIVKEQGKDLPVAIFRPSIIIGTNEEPVRGWIDNFYGPTGVIVGAGAGLLRVILADKDMPADLIPVDMAINGLLCAALDTAKRFNNKVPENAIRQTFSDKEDINDKEPRTTPVIYNYTNSTDNILTWGEFFSYNYRYGRQTPTVKAIWYTTVTLTKIPWLYTLMIIFCHLLPGAVMDGCLKLAGKKTRIWAAYQKIHKFTKVISFFSTKKWDFGQQNTKRLWMGLSKIDQELFKFDMARVDWNEFFKHNILGIRRYLFQDDPSTIKRAKQRMFGFHIAHRIVQLLFATACFWIISSSVSLILQTSMALTGRIC